MAVILIIEDDTAITAQIESVINNITNDNKILKTREGKKALEIAENVDIDIFIIDIGLPDLDGIQLAKELRKSYHFQPIIIESSNSDIHYQVQVHDQIENLAFLCKPYTDEKLSQKIRHALDRVENMNFNQLKIKQNGYSRVINIQDILYIEKVKGRKRIEIALYNKDLNTITKEEFASISLNAIFDLLQNEKDLCRCHKGYIINPKMIEKLNYANNTISLKYTTVEIPIGKTYKRLVDVLL